MTETADPLLDAEQLATLETMLPHVSLFGWTRRALAEGLRDTGRDASEVAWRFQGGAPEMIELFFARALSRAVLAAEPQVASEIRLTKRVRAVVACLLNEFGPDKDALRRAVAWLVLPVNARRLAAITARLVNGIWDAAGDRSTDASRYTKRATLAAILVPTLLFFLSDIDFEHEATLAFFDRRLQGVGRIGRFRAKMQGACGGLMGRRVRFAGRAAA
ncbi:COQ9 family protein [Acidisoma cellulosilytica]|uniref:COQ9 family protein n=1 Tax=Acidisoma cellulosilyticum TaxID=2802395 RepID=A0A963Z4B5_9PROT|nr:COQ9 family protein [Acidisoma cellulosilyticum]MCB8882532.1 COQ9 family protein [Acidisoma cellulosilyticum]